MLMQQEKAFQWDAYRLLWCSPLDVSTSGRAWIGPEVKKFEQMSRNDHQMSLEGVVMSGESGHVWGRDIFRASNPYHRVFHGLPNSVRSGNFV